MWEIGSFLDSCEKSFSSVSHTHLQEILFICFGQHDDELLWLSGDQSLPKVPIVKCKRPVNLTVFLPVLRERNRESYIRFQSCVSVTFAVLSHVLSCYLITDFVGSFHRSLVYVFFLPLVHVGSIEC